MSKAKIASKNNPEGRKQAREYTHNNRKIKPVRLIANRKSILAAEYEDTTDLVRGAQGQVLTWTSAKNLG